MDGLQTAQLILEHIRGREDYVAQPMVACGGFQPHKLKEPLTAEQFLDTHLNGVACLGCYLMREDSTVLCACYDFDNKPHDPDPAYFSKAVLVQRACANVGITTVIEISQSGKAAHLWVFFNEPVPAWLVRRTLQTIADRAGVGVKEIYPKQDFLHGKGFGNLIRYPLWGFSQFVDEDGETLTPQKALGSLDRHTAGDLSSAYYHLTKTMPTVPGDPQAVSQGLSERVRNIIDVPHSLAGRRWRMDTEGMDPDDKSRSAVAMAIACEFVRCYVPPDEIRNALRWWAQEQEYDRGTQDDFLDLTINKSYDFVSGRGVAEERQAKTLKDCMLLHVDRVRRGEDFYIGSGIRGIDQSIDGVGCGEMCILAARPSNGKTALAISWAVNAAFNGYNVLVMSAEMTCEQIGKRAYLRTTQHKLEQDTADDVRDDIDQWCEQLKGEIWVDQSCDDITHVEETIDQYVRLHNVKFVIVDYLQLLRGTQRNSRYEDVTEISRRLKRITTHQNLPMLALCQLNRECERRSGSYMLSDLRDSGGIEQDADTVIFCEHPFRRGNCSDENRYDIQFAKRRGGEIRESFISTTYDLKTQQFDVPINWSPDD